MKIIDRYITKEILISYIFSHLVLIVFFFIIKIADLIDKVLTGNIPFSSLFKLIFFLIPSLNSFIFPIATLSAILFTFSNLSSNNEIIALKSAGVRTLRLAIIPIVFGLVMFVLSIINNLYIIPISTSGFFNEFKNIAKEKILTALKSNTFNEILPNLIFFPEKLDKKTHSMSNLLIYEGTGKIKHIIIAKKCLYGLRNDMIFFNLINGEIHIKGKKKENYQILKFKKYVFSFNLNEIEKGINVRLKDKESSIQRLKKRLKEAEISGNLKRVRYLKMEIYKRYSLPFACFIFAIMAIPFGITNTKNPKSWSIFMLILIVFSYYTVIALTSNFVKKGIIIPELGAWLPNIIFFILAFILFYFKEKELCQF